MIAYLDEKNRANQFNIGISGRKNCLVIGIIKAIIKRVDAAVLTSGPGLSIMDKLKMPMMIRSRY